MCRYLQKWFIWRTRHLGMIKKKNCLRLYYIISHFLSFSLSFSLSHTVSHSFYLSTAVIPYLHCLLQLAVTVDEVYGEQGSSAGAFTSLTLGYLYLGGSENTVALPGTKASTNFVGCIRKVKYHINTKT